MRSIRSGWRPSPARGFLNSSFTEMPSSRAKEGRPTVMIHPDDAATVGIADGVTVVLGNMRAPACPAFRGRLSRRADRRVGMAQCRL